METGQSGKFLLRDFWDLFWGYTAQCTLYIHAYLCGRLGEILHKSQVQNWKDGFSLLEEEMVTVTWDKQTMWEEELDNQERRRGPAGERGGKPEEEKKLKRTKWWKWRRLLVPSSPPSSNQDSTLWFNSVTSATVMRDDWPPPSSVLYPSNSRHF